MIHELTTAHPYTGKIILSADNVQFKQKPQKSEIGNARNRLAGSSAHTCTDLLTLGTMLEHGQTIQGAQLRDKISEDEQTDPRFLQQQLFAIDIDNDEKRADGQKYKSAQSIDSVEEIQKIAAGAGLTPCIIAESFSSGKKDPDGQTIQKYHVFFASDTAIKDVNEARQILNNLQNVYKYADPACKDPGRIYFGTSPNKNIYVCPVVNSSESLLNCYHEPEPEPATTSEQKEEASRPAPRNARNKPADFDPDVLLSMIPSGRDYTGGDQFPYLRILAAFKTMGGTKEVAAQWAAQYHKDGETEQEARKAFETTWKSLTGKGITRNTLIAAAQSLAPDEFKAYQNALAPKNTRKKKNSAPAVSSEAGSENEDLFREEPVKEWNPIPYPEGKQKPQNYVDFAFENITNSKRTVDSYLLADNVRKTSKYIFVKGDDPAESARRYWYKNGVYSPINDEYIKSRIRKRLEVFGSDLCKKRYIEEAFYHLTIDPVFHYDSELNADENIINFKNGLLHLDTGELTEHTPDYLSTIQIPCNYTPGLDFKDCPTFTEFISRLGNYDNDSIQTLIEFIGVAISNVFGPIYKKALFLKGAGNCGKSQYFALLGKLLGEKYFASTSLENLESRFGAYSLYNKRLAGDPDCKFFKIGDLNRFKVTTGGDPQKLEAKGKNEFTYKYRGLLLFGCNDLPFFGGDQGKWVYDRMLIIRCGPPVTDQERDPKIIDKLKAELEAIVSISVRALKNTMKAYKFTESQASRQELSEYRNENDPVKRFLNECCILRDENAIIRDGITTKRFYQIYLEWYRENGNRSAPSSQQFRRSLTQATDVYNIKDLEKKSGNNRYYIYTVTEEARKQYGAFDTLPQYGAL